MVFTASQLTIKCDFVTAVVEHPDIGFKLLYK